jgi:hypothetical protein
MERILLILFITLCLASCRSGGSKPTEEQAKSTIVAAPADTTQDPPQAEGNGEQAQPGVPTGPQRPPAGSGSPVPSIASSAQSSGTYLRSLVLATVKTLSAMQDVSSRRKDNPLRMEGFAITNTKPKSSLFTKYEFNDFALALDALSGKSFRDTPKIITENKGELNFKWRARLLARDLMTESQRNELDTVYNYILKNPEGFREILYPLSVLMSTNFYEKDPVIQKKNFYVKFKVASDTSQPPVEKLTLTLVDGSYEETGDVLLRIIDPDDKEQNKFENYKLILKFGAIHFGSPVEQVAIMQMVPVKSVKKPAK